MDDNRAAEHVCHFEFRRHNSVTRAARAEFFIDVDVEQRQIAAMPASRRPFVLACLVRIVVAAGSKARHHDAILLHSATVGVFMHMQAVKTWRHFAGQAKRDEHTIGAVAQTDSPDRVHGPDARYELHGNGDLVGAGRGSE